MTRCLVAVNSGGDIILLDVLNSNKVSIETLDFLNEDFQAADYSDTSAEIGIYETEVTWHSSQSYEGDWDCDIEFITWEKMWSTTYETPVSKLRRKINNFRISK
jgi:hypothetical protein